MEKVLPCRRCGSTPYFKPYEQSNDGNHDIPASVTCPTCGRSTVMDWDLWFEAEEEVGDEKYAKPTAYLSARFMDALGDATIRKWNRENVGRPVTEHVCEIKQDYPGIPYEHDEFSGTMERREEIVRCRDCVHWRKPTKYERSKCTGAMAYVEPTPDGFCAWGRSKGGIMTELLPCPFCGGEAKVTEYNGGFVVIGCSNGKCHMHPHTFCLPSVEYATEVWNRRAERTCRMEYNEEWSGDELYPTECYNCSECHYMTSDGMPRYCPNCGAKVVDDD